MKTTELTIVPLIVPLSLDADDAANFRTFGELNRLICDEHVGLPDLAPDAAQMLPNWQDPTDSLDLGFVARIGDETVGMVTISFAQEAEAEARTVGATVRAGERIAGYGNSGNSSEPHVHAQLTDRLSPWTAQGLPMAFTDVSLNDAAKHVEAVPRTGRHMTALESTEPTAAASPGAVSLVAGTAWKGRRTRARPRHATVVE